MRTVTFSRIFLFLVSTMMVLGSCNDASVQQKLEEQKAQQEIMELARPIVKEAFVSLSTNLMQAIEEGGIPHALEFCKMNALQITDSVSELHNIVVRRVSDRNRNSENAADAPQAELMRFMRKRLAQGVEVNDTVIFSSDRIAYYAPIFVGEPCLQCHGLAKNKIKPENLQIIKALYPDDRATEYRKGDLRGLWYLQFQK